MGQYNTRKFHQFLFGHDYRAEWNTPVRMPVLLLDTAAGGLWPVAAGGGRQSHSLHLRDRDDRQYVLRSLNKSYARALPPDVQGTFVERWVNEAVTTGHPYGALTIPPMAERAGILHTIPSIHYLPAQESLDTFNATFADRPYLLEQRPAGNWETSANFGNAPRIIGTDSLLRALQESTGSWVDQLLYVRSRLFDMLIGDWGRHEDQWRWAVFPSDTGNRYLPIPRDRDQAYTLFEGKLTRLVLKAADLDYLQSFRGEIGDVRHFNNAARHLDRRCANEVTTEQWLAIARELQAAITDEVIRAAVRELPPEVYPLSGEEIVARLRSRRDHLPEYAGSYGRFLARHVDVPGTSGNEYFEVRRTGDEETQVSIYRRSAGLKSGAPLYQRTFKTAETKDVRLYGIGGQDVFDIDGGVKEGIVVRVIGGPGRDSIVDRSKVVGGKKETRVYDDRENDFVTSGETKLHLSADSAVHLYNYRDFSYQKKGLKPGAFYDYADKLYLTFGYGFRHYKWRKVPYEFDQSLSVRYSLFQNAFSLLYKGYFPQAIGKWDARLMAYQDFVRWTNFTGLGNETVWDKNQERRYYQLRTNEFMGSAGLTRRFGRAHTIDLSGFFQAVEIIQDSGRFVTQKYTPNELYFFEHHQYAGARLGYTFHQVNDPVIPTRGLVFYAGAAYTQNVQDRDKGFATYNGNLQLYIPLISRLSLASRSGLTSVSGSPEFYQFAAVGGANNLRGFRRDRFWGQTAFYNANELRWVMPLRTFLMTGQWALMALFDDGRVWMPGEASDKWHLGYGGGIILAPFNRATFTFSVAGSDEGALFHISVFSPIK